MRDKKKKEAMEKISSLIEEARKIAEENGIPFIGSIDRVEVEVAKESWTSSTMECMRAGS